MLIPIWFVLPLTASAVPLNTRQAKHGDRTFQSRMVDLWERTIAKESFDICGTSPGERLECGHPDITEKQCLSSECCWSDSDPPQCYHSNKKCLVNTAHRIPCVAQKTNQEQCLAVGCCWQPSSYSSTWCFQRRKVPIHKGECGKPAIYPNTFSRVIGGDEAVPHSWPWMVSLQVNGSHICGGSVINNRWILSAAHCAPYLTTSSPDSVVLLGAHSLSSNESSKVAMLMDVIAPDIEYVAGDGTDILLIRLEETVEFNDEISPLCLAKEPSPPGRRCYSTGWGIDMFISYTNYSYPDRLQQFLSPVVATDACNSTLSYNGSIGPTEMCAGWDEGGRGNCFADSGGPLMCRRGREWEQVGIVNRGMPCALAHYPTIYADVSTQIQWIQEQLAKYD